MSNLMCDETGHVAASKKGDHSRLVALPATARSLWPIDPIRSRPIVQPTWLVRGPRADWTRHSCVAIDKLIEEMELQAHEAKLPYGASAGRMAGALRFTMPACPRDVV